MSSLPSSKVLRILRLLALGLLVLGILAKPVLAASCEVADVPFALGGEHASVAQAEAADSGSDSCCPGQPCGECCLANASMPAAAMPLGGVPPAAVAFGTRWFDFEPAPHPVAIRPPIGV